VRELAARQGSAPVGSACLVRPYAEFTGAADGEQAMASPR
jgi:hypothetical protein